jgi:hypothetical protein
MTPSAANSPPATSAIAAPLRLVVRPVLAEAGDAGEDDPGIDFFQRGIVDAEAKLHVGPVVLHHDIGRLHQPREDLPRLGQLEVERHGAFVAVQVLHVGTVARPAHAFVRIDAGGRFDLEDIGAEIGELLDAGGAGPNAREV